MKKTLKALCLVILCASAVLCALYYPWSWGVERRITGSDPLRIVSDFDLWRKASVVEFVDVGKLPASLRMLKPRSARMRADGLYLELSGFFVEEDGVFIALPGIDKSRDGASDPSFRAIHPRVYHYHISG